MKKVALLLAILILVAPGCHSTEPAPEILTMEEIKAELEALPGKYTQNRAVRDGCLVVREGELVSKRDILDRFLADCERGRPSSLRSVYYSAHGSVGVLHLVYNGQHYYGVEDWTRGKSDYPDYREFEFNYLKVFERAMPCRCTSLMMTTLPMSSSS